MREALEQLVAAAEAREGRPPIIAEGQNAMFLWRREYDRRRAALHEAIAYAHHVLDAS